MKSKKRINRARSKNSTSSKEYKYYAYELANFDWDYGWNAMNMSKRNRWAKHNSKLIWKCKWREWRSWKYNRKTQWKDGNK